MDERPPSGLTPGPQNERLVYVIPDSASTDGGDAEIDLVELWNVLWKGKWLILGVTTIFTILSALYALTATEWYRADVLLTPANDESANQGLKGSLAGLGGLAGLAGISLGGQTNSTEAIAILKSRDFARAFIEDRGLVSVLLFEQWDAEASRWAAENQADWPDMRDAIEFFDKNVRSVVEEPDTGLVRLNIEWIDPEAAADWADTLVARLNDHMRQRALAQAEQNVNYLQEQMAATSVATLRQSIGSVLESELEKLMLARGNQEFAFRVVDGAQIPKDPERPKRLLILVLAIILGGVVSVFYLFVNYTVARNGRPGGDETLR